MTSELEQIIEMLIEKLGPLGEHVWTVYVRQVYVNAFAALIWLVALLVGSAICIKSARWVDASSEDYDKEFFVFSLYAGAVTCVVVALCILTFEVFQVLNPEYHAIQMLLGR